MPDFERIIIPADGSKHGAPATRKAIALAKVLKVPITALYVVDVRALEPYPTEALVVDLRAILQKEAQKTLDALAEQCKKAGVECLEEIVQGIPEEEIVRFAHADDLIVIATHGRKGLTRLLLGSITENVVRHAPCPVLVVRSPGK